MSTLKPKDIDVIVLCGGEGKRLVAVVKDRPKPMVKIGEDVFMDLLLRYLSGFGFRRFILCVHHMSDFIKEHYKINKFPFEIIISHEGELRGTAGAIKNAEHLIKSNPFLVTNGDSVCRMDYLDFIDSYEKRGAFYLMALCKSLSTKDYGKVVLDSQGRIMSFQEKQDSGSMDHFISTGVYLLDKKILSVIPDGVKCSIEYEIFPKLVWDNFLGFNKVEDFIDIGTPERLEKARVVLEKFIK